MAREGLQFTQDRLKAGSRDLSETSKSSSVSANAAGFCACERSAVFVAFRCTSGAGANRNRQGGTGNQGRGRGDKKANGISAANPHPVVKGERRPVGGHATHQTHTRRRKHRKPFAGARCTHRAAKKREPCAANLPSFPQGAHPAARPRRKQAHAKQIIAQKQEFTWIVLPFWCKGAILLTIKSKCAMRKLDAVFFENNMATVAQVKEAGFF